MDEEEWEEDDHVEEVENNQSDLTELDIEEEGLEHYNDVDDKKQEEQEDEEEENDVEEEDEEELVSSPDIEHSVIVVAS